VLWPLAACPAAAGAAATMNAKYCAELEPESAPGLVPGLVSESEPQPRLERERQCGPEPDLYAADTKLLGATEAPKRGSAKADGKDDDSVAGGDSGSGATGDKRLASYLHLSLPKEESSSWYEVAHRRRWATSWRQRIRHGGRCPSTRALLYWLAYGDARYLQASCLPQCAKRRGDRSCCLCSANSRLHALGTWYMGWAWKHEAIIVLVCVNFLLLVLEAQRIGCEQGTVPNRARCTEGGGGEVEGGCVCWRWWVMVPFTALLLLEASLKVCDHNRQPPPRGFVSSDQVVRCLRSLPPANTHHR
jgi:hypothetical protein